MTSRNAIGWQTMLADLSLILFMVTAAAMAEPPKPAKPAPPRPVVASPPPAVPADPARAQPVAVWREAPGGVGLGAWLAGQQIDSRQQLTITLHYPPGGQAQAMGDAARLLREAGRGGQSARVVMEPTGAWEALAWLAYDRADHS